jgi:hypothetical protein
MRLLLAPIVVTPTKALTPSHLKGLLWLDVLFRSTTRLCDTTYLWNLRPYHVTAQTLEYWEYLDRTIGSGADYGSMGQVELSEHYIRLHMERLQGSFEALTPYAQAVESEGYVHPASRRLIELWQRDLRELGLHDPGLATNEPPGLSAEQVVDLLAERSLCIDHRRYGGPLLLDATAQGLALRRAGTADGQMNYLICALRQLLPLVADYDRILLVCDEELDADYLLLDRILTAFGARVTRLSLGRVPIGGSIQSSRWGGWQGYTVDALSRIALEQFDMATVRLGLRLYFIAVLGRASRQPLRLDVLRKQLQRARRILASEGPAASDEALVGLLERCRVDGGHVDPYRLTVSLLDRHRDAPNRTLLEGVYA